ncbi:MAG: hypothetical protein JKX73_09675, partial [Flavobacteriales bacterium]|nr:hypothetical protein [Flavobacteriales bacterium]
MKKLIGVLTLLLSFITSTGLAQNEEPIIKYLYAWADDANKQLHINYIATDNEEDDLDIFLGVSTNDTVYNIDVSSATGDIGYPVNPTGSKEIIWDYGTSHPNILNYKVRVTADDRFEVDIQAIVDQVDTMKLYNDLQWVSSGSRGHDIGFAH